MDSLATHSRSPFLRQPGQFEQTVLDQPRPFSELPAAEIAGDIDRFANDSQHCAPGPGQGKAIPAAKSPSSNKADANGRARTKNQALKRPELRELLEFLDQRPIGARLILRGVRRNGRRLIIISKRQKVGK